MCGRAVHAEGKTQRTIRHTYQSQNLLSVLLISQKLFITQYLMHTAKELPVEHRHLISQVLGAHQLKGWHGTSRWTFLVWKGSLIQTGTHLHYYRLTGTAKTREEHQHDLLTRLLICSRGQANKRPFMLNVENTDTSLGFNICFSVVHIGKYHRISTLFY